jgi:membrane protease subunit (stomatin/prohibitin family)
MGLFDFVAKQFIDVIQWTEEQPGVLAWRYPMQDLEIQNGAQLVVRETQRAVFIDEGRFADQFEPGTYTLTTQTLPVLTYLKNWDKLFESPFKSDVYYFSQREQIDRKWGTTQPITVRDQEFGPLRIRAFGSYSFRIAELEPFWRKLSGTAPIYTVDDLDGQLRAIILTALGSFLGGSAVAFVDMAANQAEFSARLKEVVAPAFKEYGLELATFFLQSLSLPEELEQHLDRAASQRMVGDLGQYTRFQTADSISLAAENPGGIAGIGAGMGAGLAMAQNMAQSVAQAMAPAATQATPTQAAEDPLAVIEKLGGLLAKGLITQAEYDAKKAELLARVR